MSYRRGHVVGTKREKKGASDWYTQYAMEHIARIEKEWQVPSPTQAMSVTYVMHLELPGGYEQYFEFSNFGEFLADLASQPSAILRGYSLFANR